MRHAIDYLKEKDWSKVSAYILVFAACAWRYDGDYWWSKWAFLLAVLSCFIGYRVGKYLYSIPAGLLTAWSLLMGLWVYAWRDNYYKEFLVPIRCTFDLVNENPKLFQTISPRISNFEANSEYAAVAFLMMLLFILFLKPKHASALLKAFGWACIGSSVLVIIHFLRGKTEGMSTGGFFDQGGMEGCFIAITYPLFWFIKSINRFTKLLRLLPPIAILILAIPASASIPLAVFVGTFIFAFFRVSPLKLWKKVSIATAGVVVTAILGVLVNDRFFNSSSRFRVYELAINMLKEKTHYQIFGLGTGSWSVWGPLLQDFHNVAKGEWFTWIHSDFLQVLFENGLIGLILLLWVGIQALTRVTKSDHWWIGASLFAYGLSMIFNYPFHLAVHSFLGLFLLVISLLHAYPFNR